MAPTSGGEGSDPRCNKEQRDRITNLIKKQDAKLEKVDAALATAQKAFLVIGVTLIVCLVIGGLALKGIHNESNNRINDLNDSRRVNTLSSCVSDSQKNQVLQDFITFAVGGGRLATEAKKVFPVKTRAQCVAESIQKVISNDK